jgi:hypothetical protein
VTETRAPPADGNHHDDNGGGGLYPGQQVAIIVVVGSLAGILNIELCVLMYRCRRNQRGSASSERDDESSHHVAY